MDIARVLVIRSDYFGWDAICATLDAMETAQVVGNTARYEEAIYLTLLQKPNVIIAGETVDGEHSLPLLMRIRELRGPQAVIILFIVRCDVNQLLSLEPVGLSGLLLWSDVSPSTLPHYLTVAIHDEVLFISRLPAMAYLDARLGRSKTLELIEQITPREMETLALMAEGHTVEHIARSLRASPRTVRRDIISLMEKLDASDRFTFGVKAAQLGLLPFDR